jgi:superfamily II DNA/RNA helicase
MNRFEDLGLKENLLEGIYKYGFEQPSYVQANGIPPIVEKRDCIIQSQSGTGKTGTFIIGILQNVDPELKELQSIVIAPTRELVKQTYKVLHELSSTLNIKIMYLIGGVKVSKDIKDYKRLQPQIIVSTPGRLYDLMSNDVISTKYTSSLVLDEADELLTGNFKDQLYNIFRSLENHENIQVILVSATIPPEIRDLSAKILRDPVEILVKNENLTLEGIKQYVVYYDSQRHTQEMNNKLQCLLHILENIAFSQTIIYINTRKTCEYLSNKLNDLEFVNSIIHSDMSQYDRSHNMTNFKNGSTRILITTDLMARGIDVQQISMVINYEMPFTNEVYLHRSGRSGRYGRKGICINFVYYKKNDIIRNLEQFYNTFICELPEDLDLS